MANNGNKSSSNISELDKEVGLQDQGGPGHADEPAEDVKELSAKASATQLSGRRVLVTIPVGEQDENKYPVPIGLNGDLMLVPRGMKCSIPEEYFEVLQNARKRVYSSNIDQKGNSDGVDEGQEVPRFAYILHGVDPKSIREAA